MIFDKKSAVNLIDSPMPLKKFYYSFQDYLFFLGFECLIIMHICEHTLQFSCLEVYLKFKSVKIVLRLIQEVVGKSPHALCAIFSASHFKSSS